MVLCIVIDFSKHSGRDQDVSQDRHPQRYELTKKKGRLGFLQQYPEGLEDSRIL